MNIYYRDKKVKRLQNDGLGSKEAPSSAVTGPFIILNRREMLRYASCIKMGVENRIIPEISSVNAAAGR
jgi:hypothetical protein